ncbi:MAG TPA: hypothetical protein VGN14_04115 [Candidatus Elarobacter sp.]
MQQKAPAVFRIVIPKKSANAAGRRPAYVSPATQAMTLAITGPTTINQTVALTTSSGSCTSTLASTQCTLMLALAPGSYTATVSTYDGYDTGTQTATGNMLSTGQNIAFTILAGQANSIVMTLSGIPVQLLVIPLTPLTTANGTNAYHLVGPGRHPFLVQTLDADGNIIVGPGAPTFTIGTPSGPLAATAVQPTTTSPNQFTLIPPATVGSGSASFAVQATYAGQATDGCAQSGAVCGPINVSVDMVRALVVVNCGTCITPNIGPDNVQIYADGGTAPLQTISGSFLHAPEYVIADASGNLFVANHATNNVVMLAAPYFATLTTINSPGGLMAMAPDGTLYLADADNGDSVAVYLPPYTGAPAASSDPSGGFGQPYDLGITVAPNGDLWLADSYNGFIWKYAAPVTGNPSPAVVLTSDGSAVGLALDPSGNLFAGFSQGYQVYKYTAPVTGASSHTNISFSPHVTEALISDTAGNIYHAAWLCCSGPAPTTLYRVPAGATAQNAQIQISANEPFYSGSKVTQLRSLGFGANGIYVNDLGTGAGEPNIQEFSLDLSTRIYTITTGLTQPWAFVVEP